MAVLYLAVLIPLGLLVLFHVWIRYGRTGRIVDKLPGRYPLPILGNILSFAVSREQLWNTVREISKEHPLQRVWFPTRAWIFVRDPDDVEAILKSRDNLNKGDTYDVGRQWLQTGLLTADGEKWARRRKIVNTGFHFNIMKKYVEISAEHAEQIVQKIRSHGDKSVLNIVQLFSTLTLEIICESALGIKLDKLDSQVVQEYKDAIHFMYDFLIYRGARPYITNWMMNFLPLNRKKNRAIKILHDFTDMIIRERKEYHEKFEENQTYQNFADDIEKTTTEEGLDGSKKRLVMIDVLLAAERDGLIDAEGIREEVDILTVAGHETSAVSIVFTLALLAENPEIQNRARAEVIKIFGENGGKLDIPEIQKFDYLDRCIKEAMRLFPAISHFLRHIDKDVQLKKHILPAGVDAFFLIYDLHRDPRHWPEPEKFDPDRFLLENVKKRHPFAYVPFSAGPRNCIGQKFAMYEIKSILANILYNFYVEPVDLTANIKLQADIILHIADPIHIKFVKRNVDE